MSFTKMLNKRGPRLDSCGTPSRVLHPSLKLIFSLANNKFWLRVSNTFDRSINIVPTFLPLSRACFHFSIIFSKVYLFCDVVFAKSS